jgi:hypothetical protein
MSDKHIGMLSLVAHGLKDLKEQMAFVGGAVVGLYIDDPAAPAIRLSDDVDCVVEVASRVAFNKLDERLSEWGFKHLPMELPGPVCRRIYNGILVDFMPTSEEVLGFKNRWYSEGLKNAVDYPLPGQQKIRIFSLPYLIATKIEAFHNRGKGDFVSSSDIEDIVAVLDGSREAKEKILSAPRDVRDYLKGHFSLFSSNEFFLESLEGHLSSPARAEKLKKALGDISFAS